MTAPDTRAELIEMHLGSLNDAHELFRRPIQDVDSGKVCGSLTETLEFLSQRFRAIAGYLGEASDPAVGTAQDIALSLERLATRTAGLEDNVMEGCDDLEKELGALA